MILKPSSQKYGASFSASKPAKEISKANNLYQYTKSNYCLPELVIDELSTCFKELQICLSLNRHWEGPGKPTSPWQVWFFIALLCSEKPSLQRRWRSYILTGALVRVLLYSPKRYSAFKTADRTDPGNISLVGTSGRLDSKWSKPFATPQVDANKRKQQTILKFVHLCSVFSLLVSIKQFHHPS